jgi:hypothetical protein
MTRRSKLGTIGLTNGRFPVRMMGLLFLACVVCLSTMGWSETQETPSATALAQLRGLAGEWEGTYKWLGSGKAPQKLTAKYFETGHAAVVETLIMGGVPSMTTVYHLDGPADLRMTHFCVQNQPRLKASHIDVAKGILDFDFVDATNLPSPTAPHVNAVELRLLAADHITITFSVEGGSDKHSKEFIDLKRISQKASAQ